MADWLDSLTALDPNSLQSVFPGSDQAVNMERAIWRKTQHEAEDVRHLANAKQMITRLPTADESLHFVWSGTFRHATIIPLILDFAECPCCHLAISTLGYDERCGNILLAELDDGRIQQVAMTSSIYHRAHNPKLDEWLTQEFTRRNSRHAASKTHAKVLSFQYSDGRATVVESSSNLRSCQMLELSVVSGDPVLAEWHARWIDDVLKRELT